MLRVRIGWSLVLTLSMPFAAVGGGQEPALPADLAALRVQLERMLVESHTPGMALAIVERDQVLIADGLGLADVAGHIPATAHTRFRIGSTSKTFVALATLKLQAEGRFDLPEYHSGHRGLRCFALLTLIANSGLGLYFVCKRVVPFVTWG